MNCIRRLSCLLALTLSVSAWSLGSESAFAISVEWFEQRLKQDAPRLIWQEGDEARIRSKVAEDPAARAFYDFIISQADGILALPILERKQQGRRILGISRQALKRSCYLSFAWRVSGEQHYLDRLEGLLESVSGFSDWNPSHFLDTAEMSLAVALALDWTGEALSPEIRELAEEALLNHGLKAGEAPEFQSVFEATNNWNQVCNAGMVAAGLVLGEEHPELAVHAINRMIDGLPNVLETYAPDGVYIEGPMYWTYGTQFNVVLYDMLETAIGTDFGLPDAPGFMESADVVQLLKAPSGRYYNFYDSRAQAGEFMGAQLWFAKETGNPRYAQREAMLQASDWEIDPGSQSGRLLPVEFLWFLRFEERQEEPLPLKWVGHGENPIGIFRSAFNDPNALYLAFKGGRASNNHGNMDAGSFILELNGVRWALDPGNQSYHELEVYFEKMGGDLWSNAQDSARWDLLTKNNFGHNTLTIDEELHNADGMGEIVAFKAEERSALLDLSEALGEKGVSASRHFSAPDDETVLIRDEVTLSEGATEVRWQMMTQAEVATFPGGARLSQDGQTLRLEVLSPRGIQVSVTSLDPPPHPMDKPMPFLKRVDLVVPAYLATDNSLEIAVRLSTADVE